MDPIHALGLKRQPELIPATAKAPVHQPGRTRFADALSDALGVGRALTFSAHALQRLGERGLAFGPAETARLERAVDDAARKGSRESLLIMDTAALVVSVPNRTVITVLEPDPASNTVITNIDSVVVVGE